MANYIDTLNRDTRRALLKNVKYSDSKGFTTTPEFARICFSNGLDEKKILIEVAKYMAEKNGVAERIMTRAASEYLFKQSIKGSELENSTWEQVNDFYKDVEQMLNLKDMLQKPLEDARPFIQDQESVDVLLAGIERDTEQLRSEMNDIKKLHADPDTGMPFSGQITVDNLPEMMAVVDAQHTLMTRYEEVVTPSMLAVEEIIYNAAKAEATANGQDPETVARPDMNIFADEPYAG